MKQKFCYVYENAAKEKKNRQNQNTLSKTNDFRNDMDT